MEVAGASASYASTRRQLSCKARTLIAAPTAARAARAHLLDKVALDGRHARVEVPQLHGARVTELLKGGMCRFIGHEELDEDHGL